MRVSDILFSLFCACIRLSVLWKQSFMYYTALLFHAPSYLSPRCIFLCVTFIHMLHFIHKLLICFTQIHAFMRSFYLLLKSFINQTPLCFCLLHVLTKKKIGQQILFIIFSNDMKMLQATVGCTIKFAQMLLHYLD